MKRIMIRKNKNVKRNTEPISKALFTVVPIEKFLKEKKVKHSISATNSKLKIVNEIKSSTNTQPIELRGKEKKQDK